jgi:hypothetical protein
MGNDTAAIEAFIARWQGREGGQERANYSMFLTELCLTLGLPVPDPAGATTEDNDYVFERMVKDFLPDGSAASRRIDLYKRGSFVLEAKQSRLKGQAKAPSFQPGLFPDTQPERPGIRTAGAGWDVLMRNARSQAEGYARALPVAHGWPPFILVCDVGHVLEVYADFSGQGKNYAQFPDRQSFRIYLEDLRRPDIRARLTAIWTAPLSLDPARASARATRAIAERLAAVSKSLEQQGKDPEQVAMFLMRCLFTMFAEDVELLPEKSFRNLLHRCEAHPENLPRLVGQLWEAMDTGGFAFPLEQTVRKFNGQFFKDRTVIPLGREEIGELRRAAEADWKAVDPSIFGTLLEQALDKQERKKLGAHYTPRAYVERLVIATVMEPLRNDWNEALSTASRQRAENRPREAVKTILSFHEKLCAVRVLDPACGTGNFLYVSLELLKRLEGEVLEALAELGGQEMLGLDRQTVDPHQFLGLEVNPRAAAIAELVLWIGHLQWHFRTKGGMPREPILRAFQNIIVGDAVLKADRVLARDARGVPKIRRDTEGHEIEVYDYKNPARPEWPAAEFIVGNPPFIGGKDLRARLGDEQTEALWRAYPEMNDSADFVMYWWDQAARVLTAGKSILRRLGLVTTNSMTQVFQRRVTERYLSAKAPLSLVMAIADHPWTKATSDAAAVRIAMTVAAAGSHEGVLHEVVRESGLDTDAPVVEFTTMAGIIHADLTVGVDITATKPLLANEGVCSPGVKLHGAGFIVTPEQATALGLGRRPGLENHIRIYRNGRDLMSRARDVMVIDLFGLDIEAVRDRFPEVYQHLKIEVKEKITVDDNGHRNYVGRDWNARDYRRINWWLFGENVPDLRHALRPLERYIVTVETAKHRVFQFLDATVLPDNMLVVIASDDGFTLGTLSSKTHVVWALAQGGTLEDRPRYSKSRCFDPFPFPAANDLQKHQIRKIAEHLDALRKRVLAEHEHLTLTGLYNVLEKLRAGTAPADLDTADRRAFDDGLVGILKEDHDKLDQAVAAAYGWPADLPETEILTRLVALNKERAQEEALGQIRWLRPDYQIPRFGTARDKAQLDLGGGTMRATLEAAPAGPKPLFPPSDLRQTAAVMGTLARATGPLSSTAIAAGFRQGRRVLPQIEAVLAALVWDGWVSQAEGNTGFVLRKAA